MVTFAALFQFLARNVTPPSSLLLKRFGYSVNADVIVVARVEAILTR